MYKPKAKAFAPPPRGSKTTASPLHFAQEIAGIGRFPRSKREVQAKRPDGKALRQFGREWSAADISELFQRADSCASYVWVAVYLQLTEEASASTLATVAGLTTEESMAVKNDAADMRIAAKAAVARTVADLQAGQGEKAMGRIVSVLEGLCDLANAAKVHPLDVIEFSTKAVLSRYAARQSSGSLSSAQKVKAIADAIDSMQSPTSVEILRGLSKARGTLTNNRMAVFRSTARMLTTYAGQLFRGFWHRSGLKPWKAPAKTKVKNQAWPQFFSANDTAAVTGFQVEEIIYQIPTEFGEKNEPTNWADVRHTCAAILAQQWAGNNLDRFEWALSKTAAGRVWLCYELSSGAWFLATDSKPSRPLFRTAAPSPVDAALFSKLEPQLKSSLLMTGFVA